MLKTDKIKVVITTFNDKYLRECGYDFNEYGEEIEIDIKHLSKSSHKRVIVKCDICGDEFPREYREYLKSRKSSEIDTCRKCSYVKIKQTQLDKYGGVGLQAKSIKEKARKTNLERYNSETPLGNKEVQETGRITQIKKHGGIGMGSDKTRAKIEATNMKLRGVRNPSQAEEIKAKKAKTCLEHYGVEHIFQDKNRREEILKKAKTSLYNNGNTPTSKMEQEIVSMLEDIYGQEKCFPSYLVAPLVFDCLLVFDENNKIDIEYDGWYWHKDTEERDKRRSYKVMSMGYKVLRIKSKLQMPTKEQIKRAIDYLVKENHHYKEIVLDV